eukprot:4357694-Pyramimonas_sp.AAC.1
MASFGKSSPDKKNSDCRACGEKGHWARDARCPKLTEWKAEQAKKKLQQRFKPKDAMVVDLLQMPEVLDAQTTVIPKDVFEVLMISNFGREQRATPAFEVAGNPEAEETDIKR